MGITYKIYPWEFNLQGWAFAINQAIQTMGDHKQVAELLGVHPTTIIKWSKGDIASNPEFPYPSMTNLLKVVNLLDIDVRELFILGDA